jgi:chitin disaccharide deacetylase
MHPDINAGIRYCLENSLINTVAVSVCGESLDDFAISSLAHLLQQTSAQAGVHLMLTEGRPLTGDSSLTQKDGSFLLYINDFMLRYLSGAIRFRDIEQEWDAQIKYVIEHGIKPAFLNGHQHIHLLPGLWHIAAKLSLRYNIPRIGNSYQSMLGALTSSPRH